MKPILSVYKEISNKLSLLTYTNMYTLEVKLEKFKYKISLYTEGIGFINAFDSMDRSEERRVGKECLL